MQLWPGDWVKQMEKNNDAVDMKNRFTVDRGRKRLVHPFKRRELCKCIACVLSEVTYGKKINKIWSERPKSSCRMSPTKI